MSKKIDDAAVLDLFFLENRERALREVAREARINPMTASKRLSRAVAEGLLVQERVRNTHLFRLADSELVRSEKRLWNLARILRSSLLPYLDDELRYPTVILFGSVARGENSKESDVDLFIITETKRELDLSRFRALFNAEIQTFVHTKREFAQLKRTSPELINNVINGIVLRGYLEVL
jgi:predicted nucleotidyltransferase